MDWRRRVAERFREVNGEHPMTAADDAYVSGQFVVLDALCAAVDELDALEPAFTGYDRLRFGGPTSRDTCVDGMRARYPRPVSAPIGR